MDGILPVMRDLMIIGAGPAGLAAALYATRKRLDYLVISKDLGGKSNYSLKLPDTDASEVIRADELVTIYKSRLQYLRRSYRLATVTKLIVRDGSFVCALDNGTQEEARAVIVATGTDFKKLDVPGETTYLSRGIGFSSISYSHLVAGKRVFIAGDTDRVLDSALEVSVHAGSVMVALLAGGTFDADLVDRIRRLDRVTLMSNVTIREFHGEEYATEVVVSTPAGVETIAADGFFIEPDPGPNTGFIGEGIPLDSLGHIPVDGRNATSVPGLFAAGDVTGNGYAQILVSLGEGAKAALSAYRYLLETRPQAQ
jgi:NADH-dependent peroxiredoxin subunit F